jgi:hypothetical protein
MKLVPKRFTLLFIATLAITAIAAVPATPIASATESLKPATDPTPAEILKRVQARMEAVCASSPTNCFHYTRTNIIEELDGSAKLRKRTTKVYRVVQVQGLPRARLIAIDGRQLSESEQRWRISEEQRLQRTLTQDKAPDYEKPKPWLDDDILNRFQFRVAGRTNHLRRAATILEFFPRPDSPNRNMTDRVVNKISGALWVDDAESEIVRLDLHMTEPVKFWGGILGQLDHFDWTLLRRRFDSGVWYNDSSSGSLQIRKLFTTTRFKISEESFAFSPGPS